jgi:hypothetical protein
MSPLTVIEPTAPELTLPVLLTDPVEMLVMEPEPALLSSGAEMVPLKVPPTEMLPIVPWPDTCTEPSRLPLVVIVPNDPVVTEPLLLTDPVEMLVIDPEPGLLSSGAEMVPLKVPPTEMLPMVP